MAVTLPTIKREAGRFIVGDVKVYPVWNGGGTVKLVIIDSEYNVPSEVDRKC